MPLIELCGRMVDPDHVVDVVYHGNEKWTFHMANGDILKSPGSLTSCLYYILQEDVRARKLGKTSAAPSKDTL